MSTLVSFAAVVVIFIIGAALVLNAADGIVSAGTSAARASDAESTMKTIDGAIRQVISEGAGAKRQVTIKPQSIIDVIPEEDSLATEVLSKGLMDYYSVITEGNLKKISGSDVKCSDSGDLVMENGLVKATFGKIGSPASQAALNTSRIVKAVLIKPDTDIIIADSAIEMDASADSVNGTGYTEILRTGTNLPSCSVHAYMNGTYEYDAYYTLHSGLDFIVFQARNVKKK